MLKTKEILSRLLKERGVTVRGLTRKAHLSHQAIYNILNDENHRPHNTTIKKIADVFEVSPSYLLTGEEDAPALAVEDRLAALERALGGTIGKPDPEIMARVDAMPPAERASLVASYTADVMLRVTQSGADDLSGIRGEIVRMYAYLELRRREKQKPGR